MSWRDWYNNINMCLSKKTKKEWSAIANVLGDYFLIIEKRYNLELKLLKEGNIIGYIHTNNNCGKYK